MKKLLSAITKPFKFIKEVIWRAKLQNGIADGTRSDSEIFDKPLNK